MNVMLLKSRVSQLRHYGHLDQVILCGGGDRWETVLCIVECLKTPLTFTHMLITPPLPSVTMKTVSLAKYPWGAKSPLVRTSALKFEDY